MTIKTKLTLNVMTVLVVTSTVVGVSVVGMGSVKARLSELTEKSTPFQTRSMELQRAIHAATADLVKVGSSTGEAALKRYRADAEGSLQQVAKAEEAVQALSGDQKLEAHRALTAHAGELFSATADRLKTEEASRAANAQLREKSGSVLQRLQGLEKRVRSLQTTRSAAYATSLDTTNKMGAGIQWLDQFRAKLKDAEVWCFELENLRDPSGLEDLETRAAAFKTSIMAYRVLVTSWKFGQGVAIQEKLTGLDEKFPQLLELKKAAAAGGDAAKRYAQTLADTKNALGTVLVLASLENNVVRPAYDSEMGQQASMFGQANKATEVLAGSAALTASALSAEGLAARLFAVETGAEIDQIAAGLKEAFDRVHRTGKTLDATLKDLDAKEERKLLGGALADVGSMETLLQADSGIIAKARNEVTMREKAEKAMEDLRATVLKQAEQAKKTMSSARDAQEQSILQVNRMVRLSTLVVVGTGVAAILFGILFGTWIYRSISGPLLRLTKLTDRIASGDLEHVQEGATARDEIGRVEAAMGTMVANLKEIVNRIRTATGSLASSSEELSATARTLDEGSKLQSAQVEQAAVAMTQMSQTNSDVARNAADTSEAAKAMEKIAAQGREVVHSSGAMLGRFVESVNHSAEQIELLGRGSEKIHGIVDLIREIADQTNLLALNAAIEAARAGDQGRGFAVVADNVRQLAEKSIAASNEIAEIIRTMQTEVQASVGSMKSQKNLVGEVSGQVDETMKSIDAIVTYVGSVTERVDRIAVAVMQQSTTSREVSTNMDHVNDVTHQLRTSSSEMKETAGSLSEIAYALNDTMKWFKV